MQIVQIRPWAGGCLLSLGLVYGVRHGNLDRVVMCSECMCDTCASCDAPTYIIGEAEGDTDNWVPYNRVQEGRKRHMVLMCQTVFR